MRSVRSLLVGAVLMALTTLAACGGGTGGCTAETPTQGTGASSGGEPTDQPGATPRRTSAVAESATLRR